MTLTFLKDLQSRKLPPVIPEGITAAQWPAYREQLLALFSREEYGFTPPPPENLRAKTIMSNKQAWADKAEQRDITLTFGTPGGEFSFPVTFVLPKSEKPLPLIVYISFEPFPCGKYGPIEEIVDSGYALAVFFTTT